MPRAKRWSPWTREQIDTLRLEWQEVSGRVLLGKLRPHTWRGIIWKASQLGLRRGVPQGFETITAASKRTGFSFDRILVLCERFGVKVRYMYGDRRATSTWRYVDSYDVSKMVEDMMRLESINQAAKRLQASRGIIARELRARGYSTSSRRAMDRLLLPPEIYDEIVGEYRANAVRVRDHNLFIFESYRRSSEAA